jgi:cytidine deaminase
MKLNEYEKKLIEHAKRRVPQLFKMRRKKDVYDTYYAAVISNSGRIYEGVPFCPKIESATICCERVAIANMCLAETEKARIKSVFVFGPVGHKGNLTPCGVCRAVVNQYSDGKATILCAGGYFERQDTNFEELIKKYFRKFTIKELYPEPWTTGEWKYDKE